MAPLKAFLTQSPQYIRLILSFVLALGYVFSASQLFDDGIMPGSNKLAVHGIGPLSSELHLMWVLHNTQGLGVLPAMYSSTKLSIT